MNKRHCCVSWMQIGADGMKSLVRQAANIHTVQLEYNQVAVVATLTVAEVGLLIHDFGFLPLFLSAVLLSVGAPCNISFSLCCVYFLVKDACLFLLYLI